ncbi:NAD-dependent epimerase/dehydratase family protein [Acinetobacter amyesii]|uniref:NAD-dependent epimerase/dehydratase family protein n=1 Tax=Acinetobacter amyesii TaxID=2942470 RepID=UPI0020BE954C|nr:NAD-dependent epimerase/dehydratase family protein [Acinetobacter amyesii]MCL6232335.1 NAD-dependent epimerase/dehydratase family protein [Acinetobacter amyesii]
MHILFIGYGKTSQRVAKQLFQQGHQITTVSRSAKEDDFAEHLIQDIHQLDLSQVQPIDAVYVLLAPARHAQFNAVDVYRHTYVDSVQPIVQALAHHPIQRLIVVSSTRVYGEHTGEHIDDDTVPQPIDEQGMLLLEMEHRYSQAFPTECVIVRPSGIYGTSTKRMQKLAETTHRYPNIHWSNRIHIDDLAKFLCHLLHVEHPEKSYICTNNQPQPLHERILDLQRAMHLPELVLESEVETGKKLYATRMTKNGFKLAHD